MSGNGRIPLSLEGIELALARSKEEHREEYLDALRKRIAVYEKKYALPSDLLREALSARKLKENLDVVKWLHARDSLVDLEDGRRTSARVEHTGELPPRASARGRR